MKSQIDIQIPKLAQPIRYGQKLLLLGSCFTEHMTERLEQHRFSVCSNPNGIIFTPMSVAQSMIGYLNNRQYESSELCYLQELWHSWDHHTRFSDTDAEVALGKINDEQTAAASFITDTDWIIITLGSSFQYFLKEGNRPVSNNHRAPSQWFEKRLLPVETMLMAMQEMILLLQQKNPKAQVIFTVSPVRHIRDGVVENNRSKARLIELVHLLTEQYNFVHYFPAYELVVDVLRDYRYYDIDLVHPNYAATSYVWEAFVAQCIASDQWPLMKEIHEIFIAQKHKPRFVNTIAHQQFRKRYAAKVAALQEAHPFLNLTESIKYFSEQQE